MAWMLAEAGVAIMAGIIAGSLALTSFGFDSAIELASAILVLGRLRAELSGAAADDRAERRSCGSSPSRSLSWPRTYSSGRSLTWPCGRIQSDRPPELA